MEKIKILFVHHGTGIGGAPIYLANIISSLDKSLYEPIVILKNSPAVELFTKLGIETHIIKKIPTFRHTTAGGYLFIDPRFWFHILISAILQMGWRKYFSKFQADIIHLNSVTLLPLCTPAHASGAKVVVSVQETLLPGTLGIRRKWISSYLTRNADAVLFISEYDKNLIRCNSTFVEVIPNWVDLSIFDKQISGKDIRHLFHIELQQKFVLNMGGATPIKGTLEFLKVAKSLSTRKDIIFGIIGLSLPEKREMNLRERLLRIVKRMSRLGYRDRLYEYYFNNNLSTQVRFLGMRHDIPNILAACDLVVFSATRPHQSRPILEAGAMGKSVIATDFDCIHEFVTDGNNGKLVPPGNEEEMRKAILYMLDNPKKLNEMGQNNYEVTFKNHNKLVNSFKIQNIYQCLKK